LGPPPPPPPRPAGGGGGGPAAAPKPGRRPHPAALLLAAAEAVAGEGEGGGGEGVHALALPRSHSAGGERARLREALQAARAQRAAAEAALVDALREGGRLPPLLLPACPPPLSSYAADYGTAPRAAGWRAGGSPPGGGMAPWSTCPPPSTAVPGVRWAGPTAPAPALGGLLFGAWSDGAAAPTPTLLPTREGGGGGGSLAAENAALRRQLAAAISRTPRRGGAGALTPTPASARKRAATHTARIGVMCAKLGLGTPAPLAAAAEEAADAAAGWVGATPAGGGASPPSPPRSAAAPDSAATSPGAWGGTLTYDVEPADGEGGAPCVVSGSPLTEGGEGFSGSALVTPADLAAAEAALSPTPTWAVADSHQVHRRLYEEEEGTEGTVDGAVDDVSD